MAFVPNPDFEAELQGEPEYDDSLAEVAQGVKTHADAFARAAGAPWLPRAGHEPIEVHQDEDTTAVVNTDHLGHLQEWGSKNNPPHAPLRRAVRAAGLRLEEKPKP